MENQGMNGCCGEIEEQQAAVASLVLGRERRSSFCVLVPTCRCQDSVLCVGKGELVWLELTGCLP